MKGSGFLAGFVLLAIFSASAQASRISVVDPVAENVAPGGSLSLGVVGPGQRIEIEIQRANGEFDEVNAKEELWDRLVVLKDSLPRAWQAQDSLYYEKKMKAFVLVPKDAEDGEYEFSLQAVDEYGGTQPLDFNAKVRVSKDVFKFDVVQSQVRSGVEQPAVYTLSLANTGSASDAFEVEVTGGLPVGWTYKKRIFVPHNSQRQMQYEVVATDQGEFQVSFRGTSLSSDKITGSDSAWLVAESSLWEDMKASSRGVLLFPSIEQAVYSLIGLIAANFG